MSLPSRLSLGPLPDDVHSALQGIAANPLVPGRNATPVAVEIPFTGATLGYVAAGDEGDVDEAIARARVAQRQWARTGWAQRRRVFLRFHDLVLRHRDLLTDIIQLETGKDRVSALDEVFDVAINARYYARNAERLLADQRVPGALPVVTKTRVQRVPRGIVGQISPWNYPLALGISDAIPALLAGNAVVAKPDSATPFTALLAAGLLRRAGLPEHALQIVTGSGREVGAALAERCDYLMFTGSTRTGKELGRIAGGRLIGYSAELGGKNPMIVAADADLDRTIPAALSACFSNSGQLCVSIERIYVEAGVYDEFERRFVAATRAMPLGNTLAWNYQMGSLAGQQQLDTVQRFVADAVDKGARVLTGGDRVPELGPYFYTPTVLADVPEDALLRTDEVFGPVVYLEKVPDLKQAVRRANDTRYGLNASVFAAPRTAQSIARRLQAGSVTINDGYAAAWASIHAPSGGMKESGVGRRHGAEGIRKYTETRTVAEQRLVSMRGPEGVDRGHYARVAATALRLGKHLL